MCKGAGRAGRPSTPWGHQMAHPQCMGATTFCNYARMLDRPRPPDAKGESQVVRGSNKSASSPMSIRARCRALMGRGVVILDGPPRAHRPILAADSRRDCKTNAPTHSRCSPTMFSAVGGRGAAAARCLEGGLCMGSPKPPVAALPAPHWPQHVSPSTPQALRTKLMAMWPEGGAPAP
jgi:hypothetical protein